jgi:Ca2+-binding RTX toxin-like protein
LGKVRRLPLAGYLTAFGVATAAMLCSTVTVSAGADQALAQASWPVRSAVSGGTGNDLLIGGPGADTCQGDSGNDKAVTCETATGVP